LSAAEDQALSSVLVNDLLTAISNRLLAISLESDSNMQTSTIQLPSAVSKTEVSITTSGKQVAIITQPGEVFLWNVGGSLSQLEFSPICARLMKTSPVDPRLYFNPYDENRCYLVLVATTPNDSAMTISCQVILQEYESGKATRAHHFDVSFDAIAGGMGIELVELEDGCIGLKIPGDNTTLLADIDPRTGSITPLGQQASRKSSPCAHTVSPPGFHRDGVGSDPQTKPLTILKFDIHSRRWSTTTFLLSDYRFSMMSHLVWRDQYLYDQQNYDLDRNTWRTGNIHCLKRCSLPPTKRVPWLEMPNPNSRMGRLIADDEFLVCLRSHGYTAWQYPTIDPLAKKISGRDWWDVVT
jgi:hypothetical protein